MMRNAWFGTNALILLVFHVLVLVLDVAGVFVYVRTLFFPMLNVVVLMLAALGFFERDKKRVPALIAGLLGLASLAYWIVMLVLRVQAG